MGSPLEAILRDRTRRQEEAWPGAWLMRLAAGHYGFYASKFMECLSMRFNSHKIYLNEGGRSVDDVAAFILDRLGKDEIPTARTAIIKRFTKRADLNGKEVKLLKLDAQRELWSVTLVDDPEVPEMLIHQKFLV